MPVIGTGIDLVDVSGFAEELRRPGTRAGSAFTAAERRDARSSPSGPGRRTPELEMASLAARWAAKEAFIKAWSESLWGEPPVMDEHVHASIEIIRDAWGRPRVRLLGEVAKRLPDVAIHVSLSHDGAYATAMVTLSR
ncbi:holo-ACP synthase [Aeromicrobium sp. 636]|uniref:Holo-[acyl-carrier-protein] synthase n=1 Tax=Aeromicrobium senzhongii TaxID=2663859 RepID=A0A8I0K0X8_9ACTN|nr:MULTISPECIES: holo-ACP synthase [Aeromicrobium]MBC9226298.1 holo-ACP synthase [Aeromicrobium senzhongii]MCQ3998404.1 holo-ACP synthase [Aeromicrobium sp. 636]MTB88833.1 holo-ACP synthase [Aeromicrobium senzhongii]QNL93879.1 holo-ACP synthase [Aeromicrobium senzhongii]